MGRGAWLVGGHNLRAGVPTCCKLYHALPPRSETRQSFRRARKQTAGTRRKAVVPYVSDYVQNMWCLLLFGCWESNIALTRAAPTTPRLDTLCYTRNGMQLATASSQSLQSQSAPMPARSSMTHTIAPPAAANIQCLINASLRVLYLQVRQ